ncbi:hypothetical protein [Francisella adeliensis]|uniref:Uncharacterized protein n=1 Tax=Francisella adeliensis TaxID=2007306 RepID=A0A2Z4Y0C7_9GAMM|nr:hypothetical protein [Francisella adeliensis]AXA34326.1 hypothetical protein CDH04_07895 [Francisella adeliensis]MBK2084687.1 hypothetical protein [Francisella adeliensis]MBK2096196.1 hypothetical protein [Francisella adeliensis]QIW12573.1 hypothetical protein FZC43_07900 [Francisella adeliensis]QIW14446.1 hypothetical protein FZC44_07895 [Francisella adeliensis]
MIQTLKTSICLVITTIGLSYADSKIAYLGYGSLIEDPRDLPITDKFTETDLKLPIDFLRISGSYIGNSKDHDNTLYGAMCDKKDSERKDHPLYLSVTIAPDEFAKDVTPSNVYSTTYDASQDKLKEVAKNEFDSARKALMRREGTTLSNNIAFISKSTDAPADKKGTTLEYKGATYKVSNQAAALSQEDIENIVEWMYNQQIDTIFVTYFASNFHDLEYGRGMESIVKYVKSLDNARDITQWNQDNIRLLMFLAANNKANRSATRYDALEKFKSYLYEVPASVKNNTTYWQKGPYAKTAGLSGLITDIWNYPRIHTRVLPDSNAYIDCSEYVSPVKGD